MESFKWDEHFVTGVEEVDTQHMRLVDIINRFGEFLASSEDVSYAEISAILSDLADYSHYHFSAEEELMVQANIDPRHLRHQRREHESFLQEVTRMAAISENPDSARKLLRFLINWLAYHILGSDQAMARQLLMIKNGSSPEEAYKAEEYINTGNPEPLLVALNGLFSQISERNRELFELTKTLESKVLERTQDLSKANESLTSLIQKLEEEKEESKRLGEELMRANHHLKELALTDALTGLPNRRHAMSRLALEWGNAAQALSCMMVDADGFKRINDTYGHEVGDNVLKALSAALKNSVRTDDFVCRLGGDEFLIICCATPLEGALFVAEMTRKMVNEMQAVGGHWQGSISVGVATRDFKMKNPDELIKVADEGVYLAKKRGRNCVATVQCSC